MLRSEAPVHKAGVHKSFYGPVSGNIHEKSPDVPSPADKVFYEKSFIVVVGINISLKFFSGKLHDCPLSM